jgi:hypothetical protein
MWGVFKWHEFLAAILGGSVLGLITFGVLAWMFGITGEASPGSELWNNRWICLLSGVWGGVAVGGIIASK